MHLVKRIGRAFLGLSLLGAGCTVAEPAEDAGSVRAPSRPASPARPAHEMPLAIVGHATRPPIDLSRATATMLVEGRLDDWRRLGEPPARLRLVLGPSAPAGIDEGRRGGPSVIRAASDGAALRAVERDPSAVAVVAARNVLPTVRAFAVEGRSPIRDPDRYPLTVAGRPTGAVVTVMAVGDVMLGRQVGREMAVSRDYRLPFRRVWRRLAAADLTFGNLEGTVSCGDGRPRNRPPFAAVPRAIRGLELAGFDVLSLGNSHIGDYGPAGVVETVRRLRAAGFRTTGAGATIDAALEPAIVERRSVRFGFLAFNGAAEIPPATATRAGPFAVPMAPYFSLDRDALDRLVEAVRDLRRRVDVVVVYPHWGDEHTFFFNGDQRRVGRALIDAGADLVIGTHPHWVQGLERYRGRIIAHSLGNFVFDMHWFDEPRRGLAVELTFWGRRLMQMELLPVFIDSRYRPEFLSWREGLPILERVWGASGLPWDVNLPAPRARFVPPRRAIPLDSPC